MVCSNPGYDTKNKQGALTVQVFCLVQTLMLCERVDGDVRLLARFEIR